MAFWLGSASAQEPEGNSVGETARPGATAGGVVTAGLGLAARYYQQDNYVQAQFTYRRLQAGMEKTAQPLLERPLAIREAYITPHNYTAAGPLYRDLLSIREKAGGQRNPEYAASLTRYALLLHKLKRKTEAAEVSAQARVASSAVSAGLSPVQPDRSAPSAHSSSFGDWR